MYELHFIDEVQSHILGVISGLMLNYGLNPLHVRERYEYVKSVSSNETYPVYHSEVSTASNEESQNSSLSSTDDYISHSTSSSMDNDSLESEMSDDNDYQVIPLYVSTRRQFCDAMNKGIKICPRYSTCENQTCRHFHIESRFICPHVTRGSYCDVSTCELIVIRPCRKGRRCNDPDCSFKHK